MAFDKRNLPGLSDRSPIVGNREESFIFRKEFEAHTNNEPIHVSIEDRKRWNELEQKLKDYVDYRFKSIIGVFDFGEIGIDNSLTLADIILKTNKQRISEIQSEKANRISDVSNLRENLTELILDETKARNSAIKLFEEQLVDINNRIDKEIEDRIIADNNEQSARILKDEDLEKYIDKVDKKILEQFNKATESINIERVTRENKDNETVTTVNGRISVQDKNISDMMSKVDTYTIERNNDFITMQSQIEIINKLIDTQILNLRTMINTEKEARLAQDANLLWIINNK